MGPIHWGVEMKKDKRKVEEGTNFRKLAKELSYDVSRADTIKEVFDAIR